MLGTALAACSSSPSSSSTTTTTSARSSTTTTGSATSTTSPSTSSTAAGGPARCPTSDLNASVIGSGGAAGTIELTIALRSSSSTPCILGGYPGLQLLAASGASLPTTVVRKGSYPFTAMPPTTVTLSTGQSADFNIGYGDVPVGNETSCPSASSMEITPPGATDHLVLVASLAPCSGGTVVVSPVFAAGTNTATTAPPH